MWDVFQIGRLCKYIKFYFIYSILECDIEGEEFLPCGSLCSAATCEKSEPRRRICFLSCDPGCYCVDGLVRHHNGSCVDISECPKCGHHEQYTFCNKNSEDTCDNFYKRKIKSPECEPGCICKPGYARNSGRSITWETEKVRKNYNFS